MIVIINKKNKPKPAVNTVDVYIGRPSIFGNKFEIGKDGTRDQVCEKYAKWFVDALKLNGELKNQFDRLVKLAKAGKHIRLVCWCAPQRCHGESIKAAIEAALSQDPVAKSDAKIDPDEIDSANQIETAAKITESSTQSQMFPGLKLKEISVMVSAKKASNFNSLAFSYSVTAEAETNTDFLAAIDCLKTQLLAKVEADHKSLISIPKPFLHSQPSPTIQ